jgi:hypothetical protein
MYIVVHVSQSRRGGGDEERRNEKAQGKGIGSPGRDRFSYCYTYQEKGATYGRYSPRGTGGLCPGRE